MGLLSCAWSTFNIPECTCKKWTLFVSSVLESASLKASYRTTALFELLLPFPSCAFKLSCLPLPSAGCFFKLVLLGMPSSSFSLHFFRLPSLCFSARLLWGPKPSAGSSGHAHIPACVFLLPQALSPPFLMPCPSCQELCQHFNHLFLAGATCDS